MEFPQTLSNGSSITGILLKGASGSKTHTHTRVCEGDMRSVITFCALISLTNITFQFVGQVFMDSSSNFKNIIIIKIKTRTKLD